jgi:predicted nucleotidyltransferase component of viral defense system
MLFKEDLQSLTKNSGFNLWQTEKDYLQHIFLLFLSKETKRELVFKGGTALQKIYGLNRFSIDLDFTSTNGNEEEIVRKISKDINDFGFETKISKIEKFKELGKTIVLKIKGPLYDGTEKTLTNLRIEISFRKDLILEPELKEIIPVYPDIAPYLVLVMKLEEMLAEKVRAIFWRAKPRDLYDLWFLVRKNVNINFDLIDKKLAYYEMKFNFKEFVSKIEEIEKSWKGDLEPITTFVPEFRKVKEEILEKFVR